MEPLQNPTQPIANNIPTQPVNLPTQPMVNLPTEPLKLPTEPIDNLLNSGNSHKKVGPIVATLVVVLIIIIAVIYIFASKINQQPLPNNNQTIGTISNSQPNIQQTNQQAPASAQSVAPINNNADDLQSLQNDLNNSTTGVDSQNI